MRTDSEPKLPADVRAALVGDPKAKALWDTLTPIGRRDFMLWIDSAKQAETRKRRIDSLASRLKSGKRRPCCFAVVPMHVYTALKENPKAQAVWKGLSPDEKRDVVDWVDKVKDVEARAARIAEVCAKLAAGARRF